MKSTYFIFPLALASLFIGRYLGQFIIPSDNFTSAVIFSTASTSAYIANLNNQFQNLANLYRSASVENQVALGINLKTISFDRKHEMKALAKINPKVFLTLILPSRVKANLPTEIVDNLEKPATIASQFLSPFPGALADMVGYQLEEVFVAIGNEPANYTVINSEQAPEFLVLTPTADSQWSPGSDQTIQWISQLTSASKIKIERLDPTGQTVSTMNNVLNTGSYVMTIPFDATLGRYRYRLSLEAGLINNPQTPPQKIVSWHHAWDEDPANISAIAESGFFTHLVINNLDFQRRPTSDMIHKIALARQNGLEVIWSRDLWFCQGATIPGPYQASFVDHSIVLRADYYADFLKKMRTEAKQLGVNLIAIDVEPYCNPGGLRDFFNDHTQTHSATYLASVKTAIDQALAMPGVIKAGYSYPSASFGAGNELHPFTVLSNLGAVKILENTYRDCTNRLDWADQQLVGLIGVRGTAVSGCYRSAPTASCNFSGCPLIPNPPENANALWGPQTVFANKAHWWDLNRGLFFYSGGADDQNFPTVFNAYCQNNPTICEQYSYSNEMPEGLSPWFEIVLPSPGVITVASPTAVSQWLTGSSQTIQWASVNIPPTNQINIQLKSSNSPINHPNLALHKGPNDGSQTITVPVVPTGNYYVELSTGAVNGVAVPVATSSVFTITAPPPSTVPTITVTRPIANTTWKVGSVQTVTWSSANVPTTHRIFMKVFTATNTYLSGAIPFDQGVNDGNQTITVPNLAPGSYYLQLWTQPINNLAVAPSNSGIFTITP